MNKQKQINIWKIVTYILILISIILVAQLIYDKETKSKTIKGMDITEEEVCNFYNAIGNETLFICEIDNGKCAKITLSKDYCEKIEVGN